MKDGHVHSPYCLHGSKDTTTVSKEEFIKLLKEEIDLKKVRSNN